MNIWMSCKDLWSPSVIWQQMLANHLVDIRAAAIALGIILGDDQVSADVKALHLISVQFICIALAIFLSFQHPQMLP